MKRDYRIDGYRPANDKTQEGFQSILIVMIGIICIGIIVLQISQISMIAKLEDSIHRVVLK